MAVSQSRSLRAVATKEVRRVNTAPGQDHVYTQLPVEPERELLLILFVCFYMDGKEHISQISAHHVPKAVLLCSCKDTTSGTAAVLTLLCG